MSNPGGDKPPTTNNTGLWFALGVTFSVLAGSAAGVLTWLAEPNVPKAVLAGGAAFAATLGLSIGVIALFRRNT